MQEEMQEYFFTNGAWFHCSAQHNVPLLDLTRWQILHDPQAYPAPKCFQNFYCPLKNSHFIKGESWKELHSCTHWDHAEGVCLLQCNEVFFSLLHTKPLFLFWRKSQSSLTFSFLSMLPSCPSHALAFSKFVSCWARRGNIFQYGEWKQSQFLEDWEVRTWRKASLS